MEQPGITRRSVLRLAGLGAVAIGLGGAAAASPLLAAAAVGGTNGAPTPSPATPVKFAQATFAPLVGTPFLVNANGTTHTIVLDAVVARPGPGTGESFSLLFGGPIPSFGQGTHQVQQASLGQFAMFVAPVNQPKQTQRYEAVINNRMSR